MKTVGNTSCGRKADTCRLFHVGGHVKCYLPHLETPASGKSQKNRRDGLYVSAFYYGYDASGATSLFLVYKNYIQFSA